MGRPATWTDFGVGRPGEPANPALSLPFVIRVSIFRASRRNDLQPPPNPMNRGFQRFGRVVWKKVSNLAGGYAPVTAAGKHAVGGQTNAPGKRGARPGARFGKDRRRPTLPPGCPGSTIGAEGLNGRVRDGNGCLPLAIATEKENNFILQGCRKRVAASDAC